MNFIGNILWIILIGWETAIAWSVAGILCCCTVIGIPVGVQCFKIAGLALIPFGRQIVSRGGTVSFLANVVWFLCLGWELALCHVILGILCYITIIGIPFGLQNFKMAKLGLAPFGADII